ncbi:hypothetical protein L6475_13945 [Prevotella sp. E9-3]|uniref:hypothetical protein n=1 Tax=Prevotella sp. E9-3 TaxID=2913621 RepID=UPI001EDBFDB8|nr:hypothetical protein [Prevotella sp. E9-3]UKK48282.1 hypothetical protein L6475_13945 [Prevotella sp. E9-3]
MGLQLYYNHRSIAMQPPFSCNTTTIQLQYSGRSVMVKEKCYFTIAEEQFHHIKKKWAKYVFFQ